MVDDHRPWDLEVCSFSRYFSKRFLYCRTVGFSWPECRSDSSIILISLRVMLNNWLISVFFIGCAITDNPQFVSLIPLIRVSMSGVSLWFSVVSDGVPAVSYTHLTLPTTPYV